MDTVVIGLRSNGERFINYDYRNNNIPDDTDVITLKDLPDDIINKIKQVTFNEVKSILSKYL